eukprot:5318078-Alexandrium_andersonii.AAC.1
MCIRDRQPLRLHLRLLAVASAAALAGLCKCACAATAAGLRLRCCSRQLWGWAVPLRPRGASPRRT